MAGDVIGCVGIVRANKLERAVGEYNSEAPGRVRRVLLVDFDLRLRVAPLPKVREIQAGRSSTYNGNTHESVPAQADPP